MPRRLIDSGLSTSDKWNMLPGNFDRLLFIMLVVHADPYGRGSATAMSIKLTVIPGLLETAKDVEKGLFELHEIGLIRLYEVEGKRYYFVPQWDRFQNFNDKNRKYPSRFPDPKTENASVTVSNSSAPCLNENESLNENEIVSKKEKEVKTSSLGQGNSIEFDRASEDNPLGSNKFIGITDEQIREWQITYPACDIEIELRRMEDWIISSGPKGYKKKWRLFIINWLSRHQEKGGTKGFNGNGVVGNRFPTKEEIRQQNSMKAVQNYKLRKEQNNHVEQTGQEDRGNDGFIWDDF